VRFAKQGDMPFYGFDQRDARLPAFDANYEQVAIHRRDYFVPWVAAQSYGHDVVVANVNLQGEGASYREVQFRSPTGPLMAMPGNSDSTFYLSIQGVANGNTFFLN
jgi:hypothetical protein